MGIKLPQPSKGYSRLLPVSLITCATLAAAVGVSPALRANAAPKRRPAPHGMHVRVTQSGGVAHPLDLTVLALDPGMVDVVSGSTPTGYTPAQIQAYLGLSGTGAGQTIAIVDAYHDPNIASDL